MTSIFDPVYWWRTQQIAKRLLYKSGMWKLNEIETATLPWGGKLTVFGTKKNGRTILHRGLKELLATEACFRLSKPGTYAVDVGANVGHMTSALAHAMKCGNVYAYEPHPVTFDILHKNSQRISSEVSNVSLSVGKYALGAETGEKTLYVPRAWSQNSGLSTLEEREDAERLSITCRRLDAEIDSPIQVLKIDVEGHEDAVLEGAGNLLANRNIQHIIFEEHNIQNSAVVKRLEMNGYTVFGMLKRLRGPELTNPLSAESYNFIASVSPDECVSCFEYPGWRSLK